MAAFNLGRGQDPRFFESRFSEERAARLAPYRRMAREAGGIAASSTLGAARHANPFLAGRQAALASSRTIAPIMARRAEVEQAVIADQHRRIAVEREAERQRAERMLGVGLSAAGAVGGTLLQAMPAIMRPGTGGAPTPPVPAMAESPLATTVPGMTTPTPPALGTSSASLPATPPAMAPGSPTTPGPRTLGAADEAQTLGMVDQTLGLVPPRPAAVLPSRPAGPTVFPSDMAAPVSPTASAILADPGIQAATDQIAVPAPTSPTSVGPSGMTVPGMLQSATAPASPGAIPERRGPDVSGMLGGLAPALTVIPGVGPALGAAAGLGGSIGSAMEEDERRRRMLGR